MHFVTLQLGDVQCLLFLFCCFPTELTKSLTLQITFALSETSYFVIIIARDNLVFLQNWFVKFPQYRNRSLFVTGESYAGNFCCSEDFHLFSIETGTYLLLLSITRPLYTPTG